MKGCEYNHVSNYYMISNYAPVMTKMSFYCLYLN